MPSLRPPSALPRAQAIHCWPLSHHQVRSGIWSWHLDWIVHHIACKRKACVIEAATGCCCTCTEPCGVNRCRRTHCATEFRSLSSGDEPSDDNKPAQADLPHQQGLLLWTRSSPGCRPSLCQRQRYKWQVGQPAPQCGAAGACAVVQRVELR